MTEQCNVRCPNIGLYSNKKSRVGAKRFVTLDFASAAQAAGRLVWVLLPLGLQWGKKNKYLPCGLSGPNTSARQDAKNWTQEDAAAEIPLKKKKVRDQSFLLRKICILILLIIPSQWKHEVFLLSFFLSFFRFLSLQKPLALWWSRRHKHLPKACRLIQTSPTHSQCPPRKKTNV